MANSIANNMSIGLVPRLDYNTYKQSGGTDLLSGQLADDAISSSTGVGMAEAGKTGAAAFLAISEGPQAVGTLAAATISAGVGAWGTGIAATAAINIVENTALQRSGEGASQDEKKVAGPELQSARKDFNAVRSELWGNEAKANRANYLPENVTRMEKGKPPLGSDGAPTELHHGTPLSKKSSGGVSEARVLRTESDSSRVHANGRTLC